MTASPAAGLPTPPLLGRLTLGELAQEVAAGRIGTVALGLPDMHGRLKGKRFDARHFLDRVARDGAHLCTYVLATDVDMRPLDGFDLASWDTGWTDLHLDPDLGTIRTIPWWPGTALVHADASIEARPVAVSPRGMLTDRIARLAALELTAQVGLETEFVLYEGPYAHHMARDFQSLTPLATGNRDCSLDHDPRTERFLRSLQAQLSAAGVPTEAAKTEAAPGQVELTFPYGEPLAACDGHTVFKHAVHHLGSCAELAPTFMAAPGTGVASGLHLHLSLWDGDRPVFGGDTEDDLPERARHAIAGLLAVLPDLTPLFAPTVNSYKRFVAETFAPASYSWGIDNRTCAVRVAGRGPGRHVEIRLPGADANPYLALTAALAAIEHGIEHALPLPPPGTGNVFAAETGPPVHDTLGAALEAFRASDTARDLLGPDVVAHYAHATAVEGDALPGTESDKEVSRAELRRWFERA